MSAAVRIVGDFYFAFLADSLFQLTLVAKLAGIGAGAGYGEPWGGEEVFGSGLHILINP